MKMCKKSMKTFLKMEKIFLKIYINCLKREENVIISEKSTEKRRMNKVFFLKNQIVE